jgi:hypothetical protein
MRAYVSTWCCYPRDDVFGFVVRRGRPPVISLSERPEPSPSQVQEAIWTRQVRRGSEWREWRQRAIARLLDLAAPRAAAEMNERLSLADRAYCPVCGRGSASFTGAQGFAFPTGLEWHLEGARKAKRCPGFEQIDLMVQADVEEWD